MAQMTEGERVQYVSALQLLLADRPDSDIKDVIEMAFPQFQTVYRYQLDNMKAMLWEAKVKLEQVYAQGP